MAAPASKHDASASPNASEAFGVSQRFFAASASRRISSMPISIKPVLDAATTTDDTRTAAMARN